MGLKVTNNAFGTLNAGINSSATTIVLTAGQGARFPTLSAGDYFYATLIDTSNNLEIVKVTARSTDTMTVVRGQDNTTARAYSTNDRFELRPTAALFNEKANDADVAAGYVAKSGSTMTGLLINNVGFALDTDVASAPDGKVYFQKRSAGAFMSGYQAVIETGSAGSRLERVRVDFDGRMTNPYQPSCFIYSSNNQSISGDTWTKMTGMNTARWNIGNHFNTSTSRFVAPIAGIYLVSYTVNFQGASSSYIYTGIQLNGAFYHYGFGLQLANVITGDSTLSNAHTVKLAAGDYIELFAYSTTANTILGGGERRSLAVHLLA